MKKSLQILLAIYTRLPDCISDNYVIMGKYRAKSIFVNREDINKYRMKGYFIEVDKVNGKPAWI